MSRDMQGNAIRPAHDENSVGYPYVWLRVGRWKTRKKRKLDYRALQCGRCAIFHAFDNKRRNRGRTRGAIVDGPIRCGTRTRKRHAGPGRPLFLLFLSQRALAPAERSSVQICPVSLCWKPFTSFSTSISHRGKHLLSSLTPQQA